MVLKVIQPPKLSRPSECQGCPLDPLSSGFMHPSLVSGNGGYGVALVGEALGEQEAIEGAPFQGRAGFKLTRLIEMAGLDRSKFDIWNTVWCRPPNNKLEGESYEKGAINHCRTQHWGHLTKRASVVVPMGNVPLGAFLGYKGILKARGYIYPGDGFHVLPTVHPSFIQRGMSKYAAAFIHDIQKAVELANGGFPVQSLDYLLDPTPGQAYSWAKGYLAELALCQRNGKILRLAYDIETPGKDVDEGENLGEDDDPSFFIHRIGFSYRGLSGMSIPWTGQYIPTIKALLESTGEKVVWNAGFDNPRIIHNGVKINGLIHDGMVAWHILHSDLPKGLGFVATFTCPWQSAWKHLSHSSPAYYNCTDADVELRSMESIEGELKKLGLWEVYVRDVLDLQPILDHMHEVGMPVDHTIRMDRAVKLADKQRTVLSEMESLVPLEARTIAHVYKEEPAPEARAGLRTRPGLRMVDECDRCGLEWPRKDHFKHYVRKVNPCDGAGIRTVEREVTEYYRLSDFKPSRNQIIKYNDNAGRFTPLKKDKKTGEKKPSTDEKSLKTLIQKYPLDNFYRKVLEYRELDKLAGTYIGRAIKVEA